MSFEGDEQAYAEPEPVIQDAAGNLELTPKQAQFFESKSKITVALAGVRAGKTHVGGFKTILNAVQNPCAEDEVHLVCSPTYPMSRVPIEKLFKLLYDKAIFPNCPLIGFHRSTRTFILRAVGGKLARIQVWSTHEPNRLRGVKALSAWCDEGAYMTQEAWDVIQGRLADTDGPCWITTTPAGYNFIHELFEEALEEYRQQVPVLEREVRFIHWTSFENTFIHQRGFERLAKSYDSRTFAQEVLAKFVKVAGLVYHAFSMGRNVVPGRLDRSKTLYIGADFNVGNMASAFMQKFVNADKEEGLHVLHTRLAPDSGTHEFAQYIERWCSEHKFPLDNVTIIPDASGAARTTAGRSDHQILRLAGFRVKAPLKNPPVKDRVNTVNGLLAPQGTAPRLVFDPSCGDAIKTLRKQIWKPESDPPEPDKEHGLDHMGDAIGYPCWMLYPLRPKASLTGFATRKSRALIPHQFRKKVA